MNAILVRLSKRSATIGHAIRLNGDSPADMQRRHGESTRTRNVPLRRPDGLRPTLISMQHRLDSACVREDRLHPGLAAERIGDRGPHVAIPRLEPVTCFYTRYPR